jgi:hypothetical protein
MRRAATAVAFQSGAGGVTQTPLWTILVPTIGRRRDRFRRLLIELLAQAEPRVGQVRVLAYYNQGERPLSEIRQALVEAATGTYVSFVDDDDWVPEDYVGRVRAAIHEYAIAAGATWAADRLAGSAHLPDQVGWRMQHYSDGVPSKPTYHSLQYGGWYEDDKGYYRDISHLNPVRTSLARRVDFRRGDPPEDVAWTVQMRQHVHTEARIPHEYVMYHYYSSGDSTWRPGSVKHDGGRRPQIEHPLFDWHPESSL